MALLETRLGRYQSAVSYSDKAIQHSYKTYKNNPQAFINEYTKTLMVAANIQLSFDHINNANTYLDDAYSIVEEQYQQYPDIIDGLATVLNSRIIIYLKMFRYENAITDAVRLLCLYRSKPENTADLAFAYKSLADCRQENNELYKAKRSINSSIKIYRQLIKESSFYLSDYIYALTTLAAVQYTKGDYSQSIETAETTLVILEQDDGHLRKAARTVFHTISMTRLQCLLSIGQCDKAFNDINDLINSARESTARKSKFFAELLFMRAMLLLDFEREDEALQDTTEACNLYRIFADKALRYKLEFASCLNDLCYLQSTNYPEQAIITIEESLQIYEEVDISFNLEIQADQVTALLHHTGLLIESSQSKPALRSLKQAILCQQEQIGSLDYYDKDDPFELHSKLQQSEVLLGILAKKAVTTELQRLINSLGVELQRVMGSG